MRTIGRSGLVALGMLLFCGVLLAGDPEEIVLDLNPGETTEIECTVSIPCDTKGHLSWLKFYSTVEVKDLNFC